MSVVAIPTGHHTMVVSKRLSNAVEEVKKARGVRKAEAFVRNKAKGYDGVHLGTGPGTTLWDDVTDSQAS